MEDVSNQLKYILLQITTVPSLICDLAVLAFFIIHWRKEILKAAHNHGVLCLLLLSFLQKTIEIPFLLYYFRWSSSLRQTDAFCLLWNWLDYVLTSGPLHVLSWLSIERYLFAFHNQMMNKKWCIIVFHYLPLTACLIYAPCFYSAVIIRPTECNNTWNYNSLLCGGPCYLYLNSWDVFDSLFHYGLPAVIILAANIFLFVRIIWQKLKHGHVFVWHRHGWMIFQHCLLSTLNIIFLGPGIFISVIQNVWPFMFDTSISFDFVFFLSYYVNQLLPFAIVSSLPKMRTDVRKYLNRILMYN